MRLARALHRVRETGVLRIPDSTKPAGIITQRSTLDPVNRNNVLLDEQELKVQSSILLQSNTTFWGYDFGGRDLLRRALILTFGICDSLA
ncbi:hypothetical protein CC2G_002267 [Coprinopsis cinerea AmutBmut pab1-1]|nr:hypothetical protein CC2G_002267 [Coprinopsis cinerea AmutBmut pab1-1]